MVPAVVIVEYDPQWPKSFEALRAVIAAKLADEIVTIQHVGSTSVAGLAAKPILDIDIVIQSSAQLPAVIAMLAELGYVHQGDLGIPGREAFRAEDATAPRNGQSSRAWPAHHLYVCAEDCPELIRHIRFRDALRNSPARAAEYEDLKRELAARYPMDRDVYSRGEIDLRGESSRR